MKVENMKEDNIPNNLEVRITLKGAEKTIEQLKIIKELLEDIKNIKVEVL